MEITAKTIYTFVMKVEDKNFTMSAWGENEDDAKKNLATDLQELIKQLEQ